MINFRRRLFGKKRSPSYNNNHNEKVEQVDLDEHFRQQSESVNQAWVGIFEGKLQRHQYLHDLSYSV